MWVSYQIFNHHLTCWICAQMHTFYNKKSEIQWFFCHNFKKDAWLFCFCNLLNSIDRTVLNTYIPKQKFWRKNISKKLLLSFLQTFWNHAASHKCSAWTCCNHHHKPNVVHTPVPYNQCIQRKLDNETSIPWFWLWLG